MTVPVVCILPSEEDAPYLAAALRYIASGNIDQAFQCVFRLGNERTLFCVLERLDTNNAWQKLPEAEARYLAHLLARLLCKNSQSTLTHRACAWLDALVCFPGGAGLLSKEDLSGLQGALFSLSGVPGEMGVCAASVYYRLFQN